MRIANRKSERRNPIEPVASVAEFETQRRVKNVCTMKP